MGTVTNVSSSVYTTVDRSFTITEAGLYDVSGTGQHTQTCSCPGGTGRYAASIALNGVTLDSYSGNHTAKHTLKFTKFMKVGDKITSSANCWCSDCSYTHSDYVSITLNKWVFETE